MQLKLFSLQQKHQPIHLTLFGLVKFNYAIVCFVSKPTHQPRIDHGWMYQPPLILLNTNNELHWFLKNREEKRHKNHCRYEVLQEIGPYILHELIQQFISFFERKKFNILLFSLYFLGPVNVVNLFDQYTLFHVLSSSQ